MGYYFSVLVSVENEYANTTYGRVSQIKGFLLSQSNLFIELGTKLDLYLNFDIFPFYHPSHCYKLEKVPKTFYK